MTTFVRGNSTSQTPPSIRRVTGFPEGRVFPGRDEVETPTVRTWVQKVLAWVVLHKHPLLILFHFFVASATVVVIAGLAAAARDPATRCQRRHLYEDCYWTARGSLFGDDPADADNLTETSLVHRYAPCPPCDECRDADKDSLPLWRLTRKDLVRAVKRAVKSAFLEPANSNKTSLLQVLAGNVSDLINPWPSSTIYQHD